MTRVIDSCHFQDLAKMDPEDVCRRALCRYDGNTGCYTLSVWGEDYGICPSESKIIRPGDDKSDINTLLGLFMVHYLLTAKGIPISKEWISEKDIPGGVTFFRGPHEIPAYLIEKQYGVNVDGFCDTCEQLGGMPLHMADRAYSFRIAPRVPVAVLLRSCCGREMMNFRRNQRCCLIEPLLNIWRLMSFSLWRLKYVRGWRVLQLCASPKWALSFL